MTKSDQFLFGGVKVYNIFIATFTKIVMVSFEISCQFNFIEHYGLNINARVINCVINIDTESGTNETGNVLDGDKIRSTSEDRGLWNNCINAKKKFRMLPFRTILITRSVKKDRKIYFFYEGNMILLTCPSNKR